MESFNKPAPLQTDSNLAEAWKSFKQRLEIFMKATQSDKKPEEVQVAILLNIGGDEIIKIYNNLTFVKAEKVKGDGTIEVYTPKKYSV